MSSAAVEIKPKHACRWCGKPFDPEKGQDLCDDCKSRRTWLWILALTLLFFFLVVVPLLQWYGTRD